jgi:hypothetical protein
VNRAVAAALDFVELHGVVLASAKGPAPRLVEAIAGEPIPGNWWSHPKANCIHDVLAQVRESDQVLVCRLINGKLTLIHRRLWPALVCLADRFRSDQLARVYEEHTPTGRHATREVPFPDWVPTAVARQAKITTAAQAVALLGRWLPTSSLPRPSGRS